MATYEGENAEGAPGRHAARRPGGRAAARVRGHGGAAGRQRRPFDLPTGTVYPALRRLERAGLILGTWDEASGRRRRVYELTPAGARMLAAERGSWRQFAAAVTALLEPASGPAAP